MADPLFGSDRRTAHVTEQKGHGEEQKDGAFGFHVDPGNNHD